MKLFRKKNQADITVNELKALQFELAAKEVRLASFEILEIFKDKHMELSNRISDEKDLEIIKLKRMVELLTSSNDSLEELVADYELLIINDGSYGLN